MLLLSWVVDDDDLLLGLTVLRPSISNLLQSVSIRSATKQRERFWNLESVGIQPAEISGEGTDFLHDYQEFSITLIERRYTTQLPSKTDHPPLPTVTQHR